MLKPMMEAVSKFKMPSLAITDHGNMFGVIEFYDIAMKYGIKPIIGCEVYIAPSSRFEKSSTHGIMEASTIWYYFARTKKDTITLLSS